jgi:hypothetical protein
MQKQLTFNETVKLAINGLVDGVTDKTTAVQMIEDAAHNMCVEVTSKLRKDLEVTLMTLERAVVDEINTFIYPLDTMTIDDAVRIHNEKGVVLECEDGHVKGIYHEKQETAV